MGLWCNWRACDPTKVAVGVRVLGGLLNCLKVNKLSYDTRECYSYQHAGLRETSKRPGSFFAKKNFMELTGIIITVLTFVVVPANMFAQWQLSKGNLKLAYPLLMAVYTLYMIIETILAFNVPSQISVLLFNIVNAWALYMAYKGMKRLHKETNNEQQARENNRT